MYRARLRFTILVCLVISIVIFSGCAAPAGEKQPTPPEKRTLVINGWGGLWEESFLKAVVEPFEASHPGVEIVHQLGGSISETLAKIRAEKDNPTMDIVGTGAGFERLFAEEGLVREFDLEKMPNLRDVFPGGIYKNRIVANSFNGLGLAWHKERVPRAPTSWYDLWDPAFSPIGIPVISNTAGYTLFDLINRLEGGTKENVEPAWKRLAELVETKQPIVYENMADAAMSALTTQDAALVVAGNSRVIKLMKEDYPIGFVYPKEGAITWGTYMGVVANGKNEDLAMEFINHWLDPKVNGDFCSMVNYGPSNTKAKIPADYAYAEYLVFGGTLENAVLVDWDYLTAKVPEWNERWTTKILPLLK